MTTSTIPFIHFNSGATGRHDLRCLVCQQRFDFDNGETAVVLRHIAYAYDFVHPGACLELAQEIIFVEPGYDRPAFSLGLQRTRILQVAPAEGWAAVLTDSTRSAATFEPLRMWALVEHGDGTRHVEGVVRDAEWSDEPGTAEFPETRTSDRVGVSYAFEPALERAA
ncbi:MAG: hypothetical protein JO023_23340 [Chloroflexi bacterium]|nr:hypothetical protein [Chloroflexota bacterium]